MSIIQSDIIFEQIDCLQRISINKSIFNTENINKVILPKSSTYFQHIDFSLPLPRKDKNNDIS